MFRTALKIYRPVVDRIRAKIEDRKLCIEMETGNVSDDDQVIVHFQYNNYKKFNQVVAESTAEELDE